MLTDYQSAFRQPEPGEETEINKGYYTHEEDLEPGRETRSSISVTTEDVKEVISEMMSTAYIHWSQQGQVR